MTSTRIEHRTRTATELTQAWQGLRALPDSVSRDGVRKVCVILSASRSGSSFLFHLLSHHPGFMAPAGEETPFYRMSGLGWADELAQSDRVDGSPSPETFERIANLILSDAGCYDYSEVAADTGYPAEAVARLILQRPPLAPNAAALLAVAQKIFRKTAGPTFSAQHYWSTLLKTAQVEPRFVPGPANEFVFEEPPFVIPEPRLRVTSADLASRTLLLKASANSYRVPQLQSLFPNAQVKFILLSRNPASSINGLTDGWLSPDFHSHNLQEVAELNIAGYTFVDRPATRCWWKFDLPPGWSALAGAPLTEVCAFQWVAANRAIIKEQARLGASLRINYEHLLDQKSLLAQLDSIVRFVEMDAKAALPVLEKIAARAPHVMAVHPPQAGKWKARRSQILPQLATTGVREVAAALGYDLKDPERLP